MSSTAITIYTPSRLTFPGGALGKGWPASSKLLGKSFPLPGRRRDVWRGKRDQGNDLWELEKFKGSRSSKTI